MLANPQLRTSEGIAAQARFGERVPVPVTVFSPIAAGGVQTQPITSFNYENIGVNIDITPRTHHDDNVSLALRIEVSNVSGVGFQNLPTFGTRLINTVIRLKDGETNMLAGLIRDDEREVLSGIPGLSDLPVLGRLFRVQSQANAADRHHPDADAAHCPRARFAPGNLLPFRVGRDGAAPLIDVPLPLPQRPPGADLPEGIFPPTQQTAPPRSPLLPSPAPAPAQPLKPPVKPPGNGSPSGPSV